MLTVPGAITLDSVTNLQANGDLILAVTLSGDTSFVTVHVLFSSSVGTYTPVDGVVTITYADMESFKGQNVSVTVTATNVSGDGAMSSAIDSHITLTAPDTPTVSDNEDGSYHWSVPDVALAVNYAVYTDEVLSDTVGSPSGDVFAPVGIRGVRVAAVDATATSGALSTSAPATVTIATPTLNSVTNLTAGGDLLLDCSAPPAAVTDYEVTDQGGPTVIGTYTADTAVTVPYSDLVAAGLRGEDVTIVIRGVNASGSSDPSNPVNSHVTLPTPENFVVGYSGGEYDGHWDSLTGAAGYIWDITDPPTTNPTASTFFIGISAPPGQTHYVVGVDSNAVSGASASADPT